MKSDGGGDDDLLPPELWRDILSRLPVKSILRFRSVCKSWYSLISCPNFISDYSINNPNRNGNRVLLQHLDYSKGFFSFSVHDESFTESYEPDEVRNQGLLKIVGSCNGLICLSNDPRDLSDATFRLWNPAVRKIVELPRRARPVDGIGFSYFGFGFDPKTSDYKVLCASPDERDSSDHKFVSVCEVFDLSKGVWRGIAPLVTSCHPYRGLKQECYLNGTVHWIPYYNSVLLSLNMSDEIWRETSLPDSAEFDVDHDDVDCHWDTRCGTFDGLIYLIRWKKDRVVEICSVWVMKEYGLTESWTKLFNIDLQSSQAFSDASPHQFRLWKNGEVLIVHHQEVRMDSDAFFVGEQELSLYNRESKICKRIFSFSKCIMNMCLYEESLFLM